jgi:hypothetical protein
MRSSLKILAAGLLVVAVAVPVMSSRRATASPGASPLSASPPADGKYENVRVEGRLVPMIHVMNGGAIVLVDTDGAKPRTWEEQFKRKGALANGTYNVHKTHASGTESFEQDPVDREGLWVIDGDGNITVP